MSENRTRERFDVSLTARLHGSSTQQEIRISDLSERGCYVDSIAEVFVGEAMLIRILVSKGEWLELESVVAHFSPGLGFGARFVNPDEDLRRNILSLIQRANSKLEKDPRGSWRLGEIDASRQHVVKSGVCLAMQN
ncbi:MAG: PilZ domain-containing protein [Pyrinomonadaceae bacterium]|nr:PilZ domain-containing protein [Pyrinomonadaceae bacterium]